jgi:UDP-glucuronate decarboxylase
MKILVTGAAGFLGSHLCAKLLSEGHSVIGLDNFSTSERVKVDELLSNRNFSFVEQDVTEKIDIRTDGIFNLACPASPIHYQKDPVQTIRTNVLGAINMLEIANKYSIPILQASTSEVYGDPAVSPQSENYWGNVNPIGIRACYDEGKRTAETLFFDYHRQFGVKIKVARIFNTYGPGMHFQDGRVVSNFIYQALSGEPLTLYGDGNQTRSFCYVEDLIDGLIKLFFSEESITGPMNLGNPGEISMRTLAEKIIQISNSRSGIIFMPLPSDDPKQRNPNIDVAKKVLSWQPTFTLEKGLAETVLDFKQRLSV